jgi:DNA transformation protein and related proteins
MTISNGFVDYVIEQLAVFARVTSRRMFGGAGLYADGLFFGLIADDTLYLKVDDRNRGDYEKRGSKPFCPFPDKSEFSMSYFDVPADVLDDAEELSRWARQSLAVALAAANKKNRPKKGKSRTKVSAKKVARKKK